MRNFIMHIGTYFKPGFFLWTILVVTLGFPLDILDAEQVDLLEERVRALAEAP